MSLHAPLFSLIPEETVRIAQSAFPNGHIYMQMRDGAWAVLRIL